jgi:hypothetical protein
VRHHRLDLAAVLAAAGAVELLLEAFGFLGGGAVGAHRFYALLKYVCLNLIVRDYVKCLSLMQQIFTENK